MAHAYDHMKPIVRLLHFIDQSIYECDEKIGELEKELRMWDEGELRNILFSPQAGVFETPFLSFILTRVGEIQAQVGQLQESVKFWREFRKFIKPCAKCDGVGEVVDCDRPRDGDLYPPKTCPSCKGEGRQAQE